MQQFSIPIRVYIEDTDAGGIVYHVNYLKFMERSRTEFLRSFGYDKPAILEGGSLLVVHLAQLTYRRPAHLDDLLQVTTHIVKVAHTYFEVEQQVFRNDEILCEGIIRIACINATTFKPELLPVSLHQQLGQSFRLNSES